jgi:hypothetical protein
LAGGVPLSWFWLAHETSSLIKRPNSVGREPVRQVVVRQL